jgi:transposase InsO family protein
MMLDGYSRSVLDGELMSDMTSRSVEDFLQRVREKYPMANPKLIHDNGSAFVSRDFKALVSRLGITSVHTRRHHPLRPMAKSSAFMAPWAGRHCASRHHHRSLTFWE